MTKKPGIILLVLLCLLLGWALVCAGVAGAMTPARTLARLSPCILAFAAFCLMSRAGWAGRVFFAVLCCYALMECGLGTAQMLGWARSRHALYRLTGNFLNPAPYACMLAAAVVVCAVALLRRIGGKYVRALALVTVSWSSVMVVIARSRAVWLGMVLAMLIVLVRETELVRRCRHRLLLFCCAAAVFLAFCAGAWMLKPASAMARLHIWQTDCLAIAASPLTGAGPGCEMGAFADAQSAFFHDHVRSTERQQAADVPQKPFNEFLRVGMACGVPGLVLSVAVFVLALVLALRRRSPYAYVLVVLGTFAFFSFPFSQTALCLLLMLALADAVAGGAALHLSAPMVLIAGAMIPLACREACRRIELRSVIEDYEERPLDVRTLAAHYDTLCDEPQYLLMYGKSLYDGLMYPEAASVLGRLARMTADPSVPIMQGEICRVTGDPAGASAAYIRSYYIAPSRLTALYFLSVLYRSYGVEDAARQTAGYALSLPVDENRHATMAVRAEIEGFLLQNN